MSIFLCCSYVEMNHCVSHYPHHYLELTHVFSICLYLYSWLIFIAVVLVLLSYPPSLDSIPLEYFVGEVLQWCIYALANSFRPISTPCVLTHSCWTSATSGDIKKYQQWSMWLIIVLEHVLVDIIGPVDATKIKAKKTITKIQRNDYLRGSKWQ